MSVDHYAMNNGTYYTHGQPPALPSSAASAPPAIDFDAVGDALVSEATVGYRPVLPLEALWMTGGDMPQITLRRDLEFMQMHPVVATALDYYRAGIAGAEFWGGPDHANPGNATGKPISPDPRVAMFVLAHCERFWQMGVPHIQEGGYPYGWAGGEHVYKEVSGLLVWSHLKAFHPHDTFVLSQHYSPVGIRVKNIREKQPVDLWFASGSIPAKACWYAHRPRFNQFYGRSQLIAAWRPWRRLGWRDALEQVIDGALYRAGYCGPIVHHPQEDMQTSMSGTPATRNDGAGNPRRSARDVARQMIEWAKAGAGFTVPSAQYSQAQGGGPKWKVEFPDHVMDVRPLIEAARYLEDQIMLGVGVPPELVRAGGTGSGYSGRSIPREAFLDGQQKIADAMLTTFIEQVVRPLVYWNFGQIPFSVSCKSLLQTQAGEKQGAGMTDESGKDLKKSQAAKDAWQLRKQSQGGDAPADSQRPPPSGDPNAHPQGPPASPSLSHGVAPSDKVLSIVNRILKR